MFSTLTLMNMGINTMDSPPEVAGRLTHHLPNWTQDRWVLDTINGYQIEFVANPMIAYGTMLSK